MTIEYTVKKPCGKNVTFTSADEQFIRENCIMKDTEMTYKCGICGKEHKLEIRIEGE